MLLAKRLEPVITELRGEGLSLADVAREFNKRKVATPHGVVRMSETLDRLSRVRQQLADELPHGDSLRRVETVLPRIAVTLWSAGRLSAVHPAPTVRHRW